MMTYNQQILRGLTALSLIAPLTSFANTAFESGFFLGAKIGGQEAVASWDQTTNVSVRDFDNVQTLVLNADDSGQAFHSNLMGNASLGYAFVVEKIFLAAELSVNLAEEQEFGWEQSDFSTLTVIDGAFTDRDSINSNIHTQVELENPDLIFDLRPGLLLAKNFLLYGRIGVAFNKLSMTQDGSVNIASSFCEELKAFCEEDLNAIVPVNSSEDKNVAGLRVGLGLEYKLTRNLGINMDYVFTDYGSIDTEFASHDEFRDIFNELVISDTSTTSSADITKSTATVGINWYFGGHKHRHHARHNGPDK